MSAGGKWFDQSFFLWFCCCGVHLSHSFCSTALIMLLGQLDTTQMAKLTFLL
jgi:hypothetical protein